MLEPDIVLGPGDTDPTLRMVLLSPRTQTGVAGRPMDLWGKTVVFRYQLRGDPAQAWISRAATVMQTGPAPAAPALDPFQGVVDVDWLATGGPVSAGGNVAPINYNARCLVTGGGRQESFPNGPDQPQLDGSNPAFLWMQVTRDFRTP
jgi:hypothetical protein